MTNLYERLRGHKPPQLRTVKVVAQHAPPTAVSPWVARNLRNEQTGHGSAVPVQPFRRTD